MNLYVAMLLMCVSYAFANLGLKEIPSQVPRAMTTLMLQFTMFCVGSVFFLIEYSVGKATIPPETPWWWWIPIVFAGIFWAGGSLLAIYGYGMGASIAHVSVHFSAVPIFATFLYTVWKQEGWPPMYEIVGLVVVLIGLLIFTFGKYYFGPPNPPL